MNEQTRDSLKSIVKSFQNNGLHKLSADVTGCAPDACIVPVSVKWSIQRFDTVFFDDAIIDPEEHIDGFKTTPGFAGKSTVSDDGDNRTRWGISLGAVNREGIIPVCVFGVTIAPVTFRSENNFDDEYCDVIFYNSSRLESSLAGSAKIIYRSDVKYVSDAGYESSNAYWCIIRIGNPASRKIMVELLEDLTPPQKGANNSDDKETYFSFRRKAKYYKESAQNNSNPSASARMEWIATDREILVSPPMETEFWSMIPKGTMIGATWFPSRKI